MKQHPSLVVLTCVVGAAGALLAVMLSLPTSQMALSALLIIAVPLCLKMGVWRVLVCVSFAASAGHGNAATKLLLEDQVWYAMQFAPLILAGAIALLVGRGRPAPWGPRVLILLLVVLAAASASWSAEPATSIAQAGLFLVVASFLVASMPRWTSRSALAGDVATLVGIAAAAQMLGLFGWTSGAAWALSDYGRYQGILTNPNFAGELSAVAIPASIYLFTVYPRPTGRIMLLAAQAALLTSLVLSGSRGALLAAIMGVLATFAMRSQRVRAIRALWAASAVVALAYLVRPTLFNGLFDSFSRIQQRTDLSAGRFEIYAEVIQRWQEHPIAGAGFRTAEDFGRGTVTAHNIYLSLLAELGVIGALMFLALLVSLWKSSARQGPERALVGPALAVLILQLTESTLFGFGGATPLLSWLWLFAFAAAGSIKRAESAPPGIPPTRAQRPQPWIRSRINSPLKGTQS